jgi:hypothetical protein
MIVLSLYTDIYDTLYSNMFSMLRWWLDFNVDLKTKRKNTSIIWEDFLFTNINHY